MTPWFPRLSAAWCAWICVVQAFPSLSYPVTGIRGSSARLHLRRFWFFWWNALKLVISFAAIECTAGGNPPKLEENRPAE